MMVRACAVLCGVIGLTGASLAAGWNLPTYFSGTNCLIGADPLIFSNLVPIIAHSELEISATLGDGSAFHKVWPKDPINIGDGSADSHTFRFSSTDLKDGTTITATYTFWEWDGTRHGPISASSTIYNKQVTFASRRNTLGVVENQNTPNTQAYTFRAGAWRGFDQLVSSAFGRHTLLGADWWTFPLLLSDSASRLRDGTVLVANTHGGVNSNGIRWFQATDTDENQSIYTGDVANATASKAENFIPDYNLVLMYACSTVDQQKSMPIAFKILTPSGGVIPDRAYIGFDEVFLMWQPIDGTNTVDYSKPYYRHFDFILNKMKSGDCLRYAVAAANANRPVFCVSGLDPATFTYSPKQVPIIGDRYSRLKFLYMGENEYENKSQEERNTWYIHS